MAKIIQLSTGQFLIGAVSQGDGDKLVIDDPFEVLIQPVQDPRTGQLTPQAGIIPYALMAKDRKFEFEKSNIIMGPVEPDETVAGLWLKQTTGIQLAQANDIPPDEKGGILLKG